MLACRSYAAVACSSRLAKAIRQHPVSLEMTKVPTVRRRRGTFATATTQLRLSYPLIVANLSSGLGVMASRLTGAFAFSFPQNEMLRYRHEFVRPGFWLLKRVVELVQAHSPSCHLQLGHVDRKLRHALLAAGPRSRCPTIWISQPVTSFWYVAAILVRGFSGLSLSAFGQRTLSPHTMA